jgi:hypothetical protein
MKNVKHRQQHWQLFQQQKIPLSLQRLRLFQVNLRLCHHNELPYYPNLEGEQLVVVAEVVEAGLLVDVLDAPVVGVHILLHQNP